MKFLKQILHEIKNIFKSKFLLVIGILVLAICIAVPLLGLIQPKNAYDGGSPMPMAAGGVYMKEAAVYDRAISINYGGGDNNQPPITVDGVTVVSTNPFYWPISAITQEKTAVNADKSRFKTPEAMDLFIDLLDAETKNFLHFAKYIEKQTDYRASLGMNSSMQIDDKFIYEHKDANVDALIEAISSRKGFDEATFKKQYIDISDADRQKELTRINTYLNDLYSVAEKDDFPKFIDLSIQAEKDNIDSLNEQIAIQEKAIIDNPAQEESLNQTIMNLKNQIKLIETNNIPNWQYRLKKNIKPGDYNVWQNTALDDISSNRDMILNTVIVSEDEFNKNMGLKQQYDNYTRYKAMMQAQLNQYNNNVLIAQKSLDADKPDMKFVMKNARYKTVQFLDYSVFVALFAVLLGGWIIASEFQQGTIRLLMIRPKTRVKILMAKFAGALIVCLAMYVAGSILNLLLNGVCYGFGDFGNPNYTVSGEIGFGAYYIPKLIACMVTIVFAFAVAFMLSVLVKNTAVSIAVPIVCFIGCFILMAVLTAAGIREWIAYTPIPYVQISSFFVPYSTAQSLISRGMPLSLGYGIALLLVLSAICTGISIAVFKKRDITN